MKIDIVERLREHRMTTDWQVAVSEAHEAAAEIERLRAALEWAAVQLGNNNLPAFAHQVRAVLGGDND